MELTELRVLIVVVKMSTPGMFQDEVQLFGMAIAAQLKTQTRLQASQQTNRALGNALLRSQLPG